MMYKTVPVTEDNLPPVEDKDDMTSGFVTGYDENGQPHIVFYDHDEKVWATAYRESHHKIVSYLLPVGEEKLRRLCEIVFYDHDEKVWATAYEVWYDSEDYYLACKPPLNKDAAITSLIQKFLKDEL